MWVLATLGLWEWVRFAEVVQRAQVDQIPVATRWGGENLKFIRGTHVM